MADLYAFSMDLTIAQRVVSDNVAVIEVNGEVDVYLAPRIREAAIALIGSGHTRLVIDLRGAEFFDSTGWGVLFGSLKRAMRQGGTVVLVANNERILKQLRITRLVKVFNVFDNDGDAIHFISADSLQGLPEARSVIDDDTVGWHWFPVRAYTSETSAGRAVQAALRDTVRAFGMEEVYGFPPQHGSWFREFLVRKRDPTARPTRDEMLALLQRAFEQQVLDKPQAQIDIAQSQAVAMLLAAVDKTPNALIQVGSVLLIKVQDTVIIRNLTQLEMAHWERNPEMFRDPEKALCELQKAGDLGKTPDQAVL
jgi:anti-anti-sigma factor